MEDHAGGGVSRRRARRFVTVSDRARSTHSARCLRPIQTHKHLRRRRMRGTMSRAPRRAGQVHAKVKVSNPKASQTRLVRPITGILINIIADTVLHYMLLTALRVSARTIASVPRGSLTSASAATRTLSSVASVMVMPNGRCACAAAGWAGPQCHLLPWPPAAATAVPPTRHGPRAAGRRLPLQAGQVEFRMPGEFEPHDGCWIAWPRRTDVWRAERSPAQRAFVEVAEAIARFEPVTVVVHPDLVRPAGGHVWARGIEGHRRRRRPVRAVRPRPAEYARVTVRSPPVTVRSPSGHSSVPVWAPRSGTRPEAGSRRTCASSR